MFRKSLLLDSNGGTTDRKNEVIRRMTTESVEAPMEHEVKEIDIEKFNGRDVVVGNCRICGQRRVLIMERDEGFCPRCINKDVYLASKFGFF